MLSRLTRGFFAFFVRPPALHAIPAFSAHTEPSPPNQSTTRQVNRAVLKRLFHNRVLVTCPGFFDQLGPHIGGNDRDVGSDRWIEYQPGARSKTALAEKNPGCRKSQFPPQAGSFRRSYWPAALLESGSLGEVLTRCRPSPGVLFGAEKVPGNTTAAAKFRSEEPLSSSRATFI